MNCFQWSLMQVHHKLINDLSFFNKLRLKIISEWIWGWFHKDIENDWSMFIKK